MNHKAIDAGSDAVVKIDVPESWKNATDDAVKATEDVPAFIEDVVLAMNRQEDDLPVSTFADRPNGEFRRNRAIRNAVLPLLYRNGKSTTAFSVTVVPMFARMRLSVRSS